MLYQLSYPTSWAFREIVDVNDQFFRVAAGILASLCRTVNSRDRPKSNRFAFKEKFTDSAASPEEFSPEDSDVTPAADGGW